MTTNNSLLPLTELIHPSIRNLNENDIYNSLLQMEEEGWLNDEGMLRFYILIYKFTKVKELISADSTLTNLLADAATKFKSTEYDGKLVNYGVTYSKTECNNPVLDIITDLTESFKTLDKVTPLQKQIKNDAEISIKVDCIELANKLKEASDILTSIHNTYIDLPTPIKHSTYGVKLRNKR
jgi:hypothetical protein